MLRTFVIKLFIKRFSLAFLLLLFFFFKFRLIVRIGVLYINGAIIFLLLWFISSKLLSFLLLSWSLLKRLRFFLDGSTVCNRRYRVTFLFMLLYGLSCRWILIGFSTSPSGSQSLDLFIDDFSIIIIFSPNSFLFSFLKTTNLNSDTLKSIDLIFDIFSEVIIFIFNCLLFLCL